MLRCFGFTRKRLTRGSSKAKEGNCGSPAWDGACTAVSKRIACPPCNTGLWLHVDFKGNVTQIPSEVRLMLVFYVCLLPSLIASVYSIFAYLQDALRCLVFDLGVPPRDTKLLNPQVPGPGLSVFAAGCHSQQY